MAPAHSSVTFRVRYAETDAQGIVHHSNYLVWFETGRTELLRAAGMSYAELERQGYRIVVARAEMKYHRPARYDDLLHLETRLERMQGRVLEFTYRVLDDSGAELASGRTVHMVLDRDLRPTRLPEALERVLASEA